MNKTVEKLYLLYVRSMGQAQYHKALDLNYQLQNAFNAEIHNNTDGDIRMKAVCCETATLGTEDVV